MINHYTPRKKSKICKTHPRSSEKFYFCRRQPHRINRKMTVFSLKRLLFSKNDCFSPKTTAFLQKRLLFSKSDCFSPKTTAFPQRCQQLIYKRRTEITTSFRRTTTRKKWKRKEKIQQQLIKQQESKKIATGTIREPRLTHKLNIA